MELNKTGYDVFKSGDTFRKMQTWLKRFNFMQLKLTWNNNHQQSKSIAKYFNIEKVFNIEKEFIPRYIDIKVYYSYLKKWLKKPMT